MRYLDITPSDRLSMVRYLDITPRRSPSRWCVTWLSPLDDRLPAGASPSYHPHTIAFPLVRYLVITPDDRLPAGALPRYHP